MRGKVKGRDEGGKLERRDEQETGNGKIGMEEACGRSSFCCPRAR